VGEKRLKLPNSKSQKEGESIKEEKKKYTYKRMTEEEIKLIFKLYKEKMELSKIARIWGRSLSSIQYQLRKKNEEI
jgi:predicted HTH domain antitoxin